MFKDALLFFSRFMHALKFIIIFFLLLPHFRKHAFTLYACAFVFMSDTTKMVLGDNKDVLNSMELNWTLLNHSPFCIEIGALCLGRG